MLALLLNLLNLSILNLLIMTSTTIKHWIIIINDPLIYKSISGPF